MNLRLAVLLLLCLVFTSCAQAPTWTNPSFNPRTDPQPAEAGDRVRVSVESTWSIKNVLTPDDDPRHPLETEQERKLDTVFVREVLEVSRKGEPLAYRLTFETWRLQLNSKVHKELQGQAVTLRRTERGFRLTDPEELSSHAHRFLEREARRLDRPGLEAFLPSKPGRDSENLVLKAGDTWKVKPADVLVDLVEDARLEPKGSTVSGRLHRLYLQGEERQGEVRVEARLQLQTLPGTDTRVEKGGRWLVKVTWDWPLAAPLIRANEKMLVEFEGTGRNKWPDGRKYSLEAISKIPLGWI